MLKFHKTSSVFEKALWILYRTQIKGFGLLKAQQKSVLASNLKNEKFTKMIRELPERYHDPDKNKFGKSFTLFQKAVVLKSRINRKGHAAPNFSDIPCQRPIDLLMTIILKKGPLSRENLYQEGVAGGFLNSKTHLRKIMKQLVKEKIITPFTFSPDKPQRYRFNVAAMPKWVQYVERAKIAREKFLREFQRRYEESVKANKEREAKLHESETVEGAEVSESEGKLPKSGSAEPNRWDVEREKRKVLNGDAKNENVFSDDEGGDEYIGKSVDETQSQNMSNGKLKDSSKSQGIEEIKSKERKKAKEDWEEMMLDGVGFVHPGQRATERGSVFMHRKVLMRRILGKTGESPKNRKKALKAIVLRRKEIADVRKRYGRE